MASPLDVARSSPLLISHSTASSTPFTTARASDLALMDSIQFYQLPAVRAAPFRKFSAPSGVRGSSITKWCPPRLDLRDARKRLWDAPSATGKLLNDGAIPARIGYVVRLVTYR
jgi:hypothetical protein